MSWPDHPELPSHGYVITRADLDGLVAARAEKAGAVLWQGAEAVAPLEPHGVGPRPDPVPDARPAPRRAAAPCVSDRAPGARLDRGQGPVCDRGRRLAVAVRSAARDRPATGTGRRGWRFAATTAPRATPRRTSTRSSTSATRAGKVVPGYGWIFPLGDGRVNVGVGLLSTKGRWKQRQHQQAHGRLRRPGSRRHGASTRRPSCGPPTGGRLPMGLAVGPRVGPDCVAAGDAGGLDQPVQRRGHRLRLRDGPAGRRHGRATRSRCGRPAPARRATSEHLQEHLRPLLPGRPGLHRRALAARR